VVQRPVLYLGEINDNQHAAWCRLIEAFDEGSGRHRQLALFPAERPMPDLGRIDLELVLRTADEDSRERTRGGS
jgi:hypothetical protein